MGSLGNHKSQGITKMILIGDAKAGKTGALASLVKVGYKLRILDYDNLLDSLRYQIEHTCPDKIGNVEYRSLRDKRKASPLGPIIDGVPRAFSDGLKMLDHWKYTDTDGTEIDYGKPKDWGSDTILVLDSLSRFCDAAYAFREPLTPKGKSGEADGRAVYGDAQSAVEDVLAMLSASAFNTNVIIIAHILYMELDSGEKKGFPQAVGQKLSPKIPQYFPTVAMFTKKGSKRVLQTNDSPLIDLANPAPFKMAKELPIETGLADFFGTLRPHPDEQKPTLVRKA
jgi:hypothetical protein